jgi:heme-degrading monooxygenase HmoA
MSQEILSIAIFELLPGKEQEALVTLRELKSVLETSGYSRDFLFRDSINQQYVLLRYWKSEEALRNAHEDPKVHRWWAKLGHEIQVLKIHERLEEAGL